MKGIKTFVSLNLTKFSGHKVKCLFIPEIQCYPACHLEPQPTPPYQGKSTSQYKQMYN